MAKEAARVMFISPTPALPKFVLDSLHNYANFLWRIWGGRHEVAGGAKAGRDLFDCFAYRKYKEHE